MPHDPWFETTGSVIAMILASIFIILFLIRIAHVIHPLLKGKRREENVFGPLLMIVMIMIFMIGFLYTEIKEIF